jgi:hypothetical protein
LIEQKGYSPLQKTLEINQVSPNYEVPNLGEITGKKLDLLQFTMSEASSIRKAAAHLGDDPVSN